VAIGSTVVVQRYLYDVVDGCTVAAVCYIRVIGRNRDIANFTRYEAVGSDGSIHGGEQRGIYAVD
jgi:hypothetical protein